MTKSQVRRNVLVLALCQALSMTAMTITVTVTALNGEALVTAKAWATVPIGLQAVATMLTTIPASASMRARGRRFGFTLGALVGIVGGALGVLSVIEHSFWLLCLANVAIGVAMGFAVFYRFAAATRPTRRFAATRSRSFWPAALSPGSSVRPCRNGRGRCFRATSSPGATA